MNKRLINTEAKAFLLVFALAAIVIGAYTVLGTLVLRGNEQIGHAGMWVLLAISGTALLSAATALAVIAGGRVGGWWLLGSALASVAWFPAGLLLGEQSTPTQTAGGNVEKDHFAGAADQRRGQSVVSVASE